LAGAHILNRYLCHRCRDCSHWPVNRSCGRVL
jgi:hypothetical protein